MMFRREAEPDSLVSQKCFAVFDQATGAFLTPWFSQTTASGKRAFAIAAMNPESPMFTHGADYTLFELGWFDAANGKVRMYEASKGLGNALQFQALEPGKEVE